MSEADTSNVDVHRLQLSNRQLNAYVNSEINSIRSELGLTLGVECTEHQRRTLVARLSSLGKPRGSEALVTFLCAIIPRSEGGPWGLRIGNAKFSRAKIEKWAVANLPIQEAGLKYQGANWLKHGLAWWTGRSAVSPSIVIETKIPTPSGTRRVAIGTDKLSHFFAQGYEYFVIAILQRRGPRAAIEYGKASEEGKYGLKTTGVYSFADLEANWSGFKFYRGLYQDPFLDFDIANYAHPQWNEDLNPNYYSKSVALLVARNSPYIRAQWRSFVQEKLDLSIPINLEECRSQFEICVLEHADKIRGKPPEAGHWKDSVPRYVRSTHGRLFDTQTGRIVWPPRYWAWFR